MNTETLKDNGLAAKLEALTPKSLDDIIRKNRKQCQIRHATEKDLSSIYGEVSGNDGHLKLVITQYHLVSIATQDKLKTVLLGNVGDSEETWVTSTIIKLDLNSGYLITHSDSLYKMSGKAISEPTFEQLALLCRYVRRSGAGDYFGVPEFL